MFENNQYCLLDFGEGRKLERFGEVVLDRPSPAAADVPRADPRFWETANARFDAAGEANAGCGLRGCWTHKAALPDRWTVEHPPLVFELRPTEFGHVGVFPEQAENWEWIARQFSKLRSAEADPGSFQEKSRVDRPRVLNLFAYTGGSTLAAAAAGAEVVHVDAAKSTVAWARRNAGLSGLSAAPIRWIAEDAPRFVERELKRGNRYHGIILDPPGYGHGPKGETWQLDRDLPRLLGACASVLTAPGFMLVTCHSAGITAHELQLRLIDALPSAAGIEAHDLYLLSAHGQHLHSGVAVRRE